MRKETLIFILHVVPVLSFAQKVGIGTSTPFQPLTIQADATHGLLGFKNNQGNAKWHWWLPGNQDLVLTESTVADYRMTIKPGGNIGIDLASPQEKLHVNGNVKVNQNLIVSGTAKVNNLIGAGNRYVGATQEGQLLPMSPQLTDVITNLAPQVQGEAPLEIYSTSTTLVAGRAMIMLSGTAFRQAPGAMKLQVRFHQVEQPNFMFEVETDVYANSASMHLAFPMVQKCFTVIFGGTYHVKVNLVAGNGYDSEVDYNDRLNVAVIQF